MRSQELVDFIFVQNSDSLFFEWNTIRHARRFQGEQTCVNLLFSLPPRRSWGPESYCLLRPMPVATGWARPDIIGISTAPVLTGSTPASASAGMAVAGIARALLHWKRTLSFYFSKTYFLDTWRKSGRCPRSIVRRNDHLRPRPVIETVIYINAPASQSPWIGLN